MLHITACLSLAPCLWLPLSARRQHDLVDEVDDGGGRLFGVQLGKQVADVLCQAARLLSYETKNPERRGVEKEKEDVRKRKGRQVTEHERKRIFSFVM